jgi:hypothetical protein
LSYNIRELLKRKGWRHPPHKEYDVRYIATLANKIIVRETRKVKPSSLTVVGAVLPLERREGWHRRK